MVVYAKENEPKWDYQDCVSVINFIEDNLDQFTEEYNKTVENDLFLNANEIEFSSVILLVEDNNYGAYIDFDGENGYVVVTGNYTIYDMQVNGDLESLRLEENILYSRLDGFLILDEEGNVQKAEADLNYEVSDVTDKTIYPGQYEEGDGEIEVSQIDAYVAARYPKYSTVKLSVDYLGGFECSDQSATSYYRSNSKPSEENCALNAAYSVLKSWHSRGFIKYMPKGTQDLTTSIVNDVLYPTYGVGPDWYPNWNYLDKIPILYSELRDYAVKNSGYTPESGLTRQAARNAMSYVSALHGNSIKLNYTSVISAVINYLGEGKACYFSIQGSTTYDNHAVALLGWRIYTYESGWWIFKKTHDAYFYKIADGWSTTPKYFDPHTGAKLNMEVTYLESY